MEGEEGKSGDDDDHREEHDGDKPSGSIGCFWRGLSDAEGIDEDICEIK